MIKFEAAGGGCWGMGLTQRRKAAKKEGRNSRKISFPFQDSYWDYESLAPAGRRLVATSGATESRNSWRGKPVVFSPGGAQAIDCNHREHNVHGREVGFLRPAGA